MTMETKMTHSMTQMMKKIGMTGLMALVAAGVTLPLPAQQAGAATKAKPTVAANSNAAKPAVAEEEEESNAPKKPGQEGIKVHGHWIIDRLDKDGKVLEHRDFQNALQGPDMLMYLIFGKYVPSALSIVANDTSAEQSYYMIPTGTNAVSIVCSGLAASNNSVSANFCGTGLSSTITYVSGAFGSSYPTGIVLQGQFTALSEVNINTVQTILGTCQNGNGFFTPTPSSTSPADCMAGAVTAVAPVGQTPGVAIRNFTGTTITPIDVKTGQSLSITVTITFS